MTWKTILYTLLAVALVAAGLFIGYKWCESNIEPEVVVKTEYKTVTVEKLVPVASASTGKIIFVHVNPDTVRMAPIDSSETTAVVELPEELVEYNDSSELDNGAFLHYQIGVKGYQPSLAYANFEVPCTTVTETIVKKKPVVSFGWGLMLGGGYGFINKKFDVFVGAGVSLNFNIPRK